MKLFAEGICEICGNRGHHLDCEDRARRMAEEHRAADGAWLRRHARFGDYGVHSLDSEQSLALARRRLEAWLKRPANFDRSRCVEGRDWWFLPESWIGTIGFIIEHRSGAVFHLGSGIPGRAPGELNLTSSCLAIAWYLDGHAAGDRVA